MKRDKKKNQSTLDRDEVHAFLGDGIVLEGTLRFEGTARIDGEFKGEIHSTGTLIVGDTARIEGTVEVDTLILSGWLNGTIRTASRLEAYPPGKIIGDIFTPVLVIHEGVIFQGKSTMADKTEAISKKEAIEADVGRPADALGDDPIPLEDLLE